MRLLLNPKPGDLILLFKNNGRKTANLLAQTLLRGRAASVRHVAITLDPIHALHATPESGVHVVELHTLLAGSTQFMVLRRVDLSPALTVRFDKALHFYLHQRYNKWFHIGRGEKTSYCSELAAKVYKKAGIPFSDRVPRRTIPEDILMLSSSPSFCDVTGEYADELSELTQEELSQEIINIANHNHNQLAEAYRSILEYKEQMRSSSLLLNETRWLLKRIKRRFNFSIPTLPPPSRYWESSNWGRRK